MTTTLPLSILEGMLNDIKLDEITYESIAMEMEKDEKEGKQGKEPVPSDERVEAVQEANNRGKGSDLSMLWEENKASSTSPRRRKSGKLSKSESK